MHKPTEKEYKTTLGVMNKRRERLSQKTPELPPAFDLRSGTGEGSRYRLIKTSEGIRPQLNTAMGSR
jgi:hypothetical protein